MVTQSFAEAEYIAAAGAANQAIWLRNLMADLGMKQTDATVIWVDNKSAISIAKNPVFHGRTKHIKVKFHAVREVEASQEIKLLHCNLNEQISNVLTKGL